MLVWGNINFLHSLLLHLQLMLNDCAPEFKKLCEMRMKCAIMTDFTGSAKEMNLTLILKVKKQLTGSVPISVCLSGSGLVWKKHHGHKMGLEQTPLQGYHPSLWTSSALRQDLSPQLDKNTLVEHTVYGILWQQVAF